LIRKGQTSAVLHEFIWYCYAVPDKARHYQRTNRRSA